MTLFSVFTHPKYTNKIVLLPQKFSFWTLVFGGIVFFFKKCWISGFIACAVTVIIKGLVQDPFLYSSLLWGFNLLLACSAQDITRWELTFSGWNEDHVVAGHNRQEAFLRLLDNVPELLERKVRL